MGTCNSMRVICGEVFTGMVWGGLCTEGPCMEVLNGEVGERRARAGKFFIEQYFKGLHSA